MRAKSALFAVKDPTRALTLRDIVATITIGGGAPIMAFRDPMKAHSTWDAVDSEERRTTPPRET
jgi:hypothetical protein